MVVLKVRFSKDGSEKMVGPFPSREAAERHLKRNGWIPHQKREGMGWLEVRDPNRWIKDEGERLIDSVESPIKYSWAIIWELFPLETLKS